MRKQELLLEVKGIRQRLEEAEDTIRAIRVGQVDAVVVSAPKGERVFVLKGAEEPYRIFLETMSEGAATLMADGTIAYGNQRFAEMLKTPLERVMGASLEGFVHPERRHCLPPLMARALAGEATEEIPFLTGDGTTGRPAAPEITSRFSNESAAGRPSSTLKPSGFAKTASGFTYL